MSSESVEVRHHQTQNNDKKQLSDLEVCVSVLSPETEETSLETGESQGSAPQAQRTFSKVWTVFVLSIRKPITKVLLAITGHAARNPKSYVISIILLSLGMVVTGTLTNFSFEVNENVLWTPMGSRSLSHGNWIDDESGFPAWPRRFSMSVHAEGQGVLGQEGVSRVFAALDTVRGLTGYNALCQQSDNTNFVDENGDVTCAVTSPTKFWNNSYEIFEVEVSSDASVKETLSRDHYPDGAPVDVLAILGNSETSGDGTLTSAQIYKVLITLPDVDDAEAFERDAIDALLALDDDWQIEPDNKFRVEVFAQISFSDEFTRAIVSDIPLVPGVFIVMSCFTCVVFFRRDWVYSRSLLGFGAVVAVLLSIMTGYGLLFIIGVPLTSITQILPFIVFGIGLDDSFIITCAYHRTDGSKDPVDRINDTIEEVGNSIFVTTVTSAVAFGLGCMSSVPAVYWLCLYAFPTLLVDFVFQITFFIALIVLDERRVRDKRRDLLVCSTVKSHVDSKAPEPEGNAIHKYMELYGNFLMKGCVKTVVILSFGGLLVSCVYSASLLEEAFKFTDVVPDGSYVTDFRDSLYAYSEGSGVFPTVFFRFVDQSDEKTQQQMEDYVNDLVGLDLISNQPPFFWLRDFKNFVLDESLTFEEKMDAFLSDPVYSKLYGQDIVRDQTGGKVLASRTTLRMSDDVELDDVHAQVDALLAQRKVTQSQPVNMGQSEWPFFTFDKVHYLWELYDVAPDELTLSTVFGVMTVTVIGTLFIPHWTAFFFVGPLISILYVDLLGVSQFAGIKINAVSNISLVLSIGLFVDFLVHVLLRYYESQEKTREAKVKDTLRTMGASILIGGISTFLGVIPLAFSSSEIFNTIFVTFMGLVTLGIGHGLILVPVLLSIFGTEEVLDLGLAHTGTSTPATKTSTGRLVKEEMVTDKVVDWEEGDCGFNEASDAELAYEC